MGQGVFITLGREVGGTLSRDRFAEVVRATTKRLQKGFWFRSDGSDFRVRDDDDKNTILGYDEHFSVFIHRMYLLI